MTQGHATHGPEPDDDLPPPLVELVVPHLPADEFPDLDEDEPPDVVVDDVPQLPSRTVPEPGTG